MALIDRLLRRPGAGFAAAAGTPPSGFALRFDGVNDRVVLGTPSSLGTAKFTLEVWFMREGPGVATSTGTDGLTAAVPLITKGAAEAENSNKDANYILAIDNKRRVLAADFEQMPVAPQPAARTIRIQALRPFTTMCGITPPRPMTAARGASI